MRQLEANNSGLLFYLVNFYTLVLMVLSLGMEAAIGYFAAKKQSFQLKLLNFSIVATVVVSIAAFLIFLVLPYFNLLDRNLETPVILAVCFIAGNFLLGCGSVLFYAREDFITSNLLSTALNIFLIIYFLQGPSYEDARMIYFGSFAAIAFVIVIAFYFKYANRSGGGFLTKSEIKELYAFSLRAYMGNLLFFLLYRIDYWFVEEYCTGQELGNYIQVSKLAQMFFVLPGILASAVFPYTASGKRDEVKSILTSLCRALLFIYSIVCIILIITGKWLFPWLYGGSFEKMYYPFLLLIPGILALSTLYTLTAYYAGKNRLKVNLVGAVIALVVIIGGDIIFIPRYGINAAALVSSAGYIIYHFYVLSFFSKEYHTPMADFFKIKISDLAAIVRILKRDEKSHNEVKQ